jgi:hypothetical protein
MTSDRKFISNRKNAQKSSGPKTDAGEHRAARNAVKHGLAIPINTIPELRKDFIPSTVQFLGH